MNALSAPLLALICSFTDHKDHLLVCGRLAKRFREAAQRTDSWAPTLTLLRTFHMDCKGFLEDKTRVTALNLTGNNASPVLSNIGGLSRLVRLSIPNNLHFVSND